MSTQTTHPAGPVPADYAGASLAATAKRLLHATRPKFFTASALPVVAGTAWGLGQAGSFQLAPFLLALVAVVLVNAAANVLNDVGDDIGGTDRHNPGAIYPYTGGSRFIQAGILDRAAMTRFGIGLLAAAAVAGLALVVIKGPTVLAFGLAGTLLGVAYSLGPFKLSGAGLGEAAIAVGCGILPISGAAWLQGGLIDGPLLLFAVPVSAWVAAILLVNEVPDIAADAATGKRTLPVRLGHRLTARLYLAIQGLALAAIAGLAVAGKLPLATILVPAALVPKVVRAAATVRNDPGDRAAMQRAIESTILVHGAGTAWLTACALFAALSARH